MDRGGRGRGAKRRFHGGWAQRGQLVPLYACEPRRRDIAPRDTHAVGDAGGATVSGPSGIIDVSHREQRAACSSRSDGINRRDR